MKRILTIGIIVLFIGMSISSSTGFNVDKVSTTAFDGKTLYVGGSGPGNYTKIQDAIDDASYGDTVFVYNGGYGENIIVYKSISLIGEDKDHTGIYGNGGTTINVVANEVEISGFQIGNSILYSVGVGLCASNNSKIHGNRIDEGETRMIVFYSKGNEIYSNVFCGPWVDLSILLFHSHHNIIYNNSFPLYDNKGSLLEYSNNNKIFGNNLTLNEEYAIRLQNSCQNEIFSNVIKYCGDEYYGGGGILLNNSDENIIHNNTIHDNIDGISLQKSDKNHICHNDIFGHAEQHRYCYGIKLKNQILPVLLIINLTIIV